MLTISIKLNKIQIKLARIRPVFKVQFKSIIKFRTLIIFLIKIQKKLDNCPVFVSYYP